VTPAIIHPSIRGGVSWNACDYEEARRQFRCDQVALELARIEEAS
jgi:hypothetical protein